MSLSVKVSFQTKNQKCGMNSHGEDYNVVEIRRFFIDENVATNYDYLRAKIVSIVPRLENKAFRLYWKDNENDLVAFSSDDELIEALVHVADVGSDGILCLHVEEMIDDDHHFLPPSSSTTPTHCDRASETGIGSPFLDLLKAVSGICGPLLNGLGSAAFPGRHQDDGTSSSTAVSRRSDDVTDNCQVDQPVDDGTKYEASNVANREPAAAAALSDGLIQVVESLKEMGFNDDDGWLTRLVTSRGGHIETVIEAMQTCGATC